MLLAAAALVLLLVALRLSPLGDALSLEKLRQHQTGLLALVEQRPILAALLFLGAYVAVVALSLPGATVMTLTSGFLFGPLPGTALAATGATLGAALVFLLARRILGADGLESLGERGARLAALLRQDGFLVLLALRLVPLFPFVLVNLLPPLAGMRLPVFLGATALGVVPATFAFALAGSGLGDALEGGRVLTPGLILALCGLALVVLLGIPLRRWLERR
ncbi:TVP38/TMEM64 family protein [Sabulicella glaciei]|uniref:TVP38/TMEM64 family membrane protein n=1 Tax=Sabulicella glaciei TaxID=2984948 RepID=A0ABT3NRA5_9PROT|nr:VTT domain-containing protein [Roseococcus sp. MDT2-1-1]MCW8084690.1 VTT domain-containing protein [Roseococcus sp. MDT2-1-1]